MIFNEGFTKKYRSLRNQKSSMFYLEDFYYKALQINIDKGYNLYLKNSLLAPENRVVTVNFPEFLDVSTNLNLIKNIHTGFDISLNEAGTFKTDLSSSPVNLITSSTKINDVLKVPKSIFTEMRFKEIPVGLFRLFFGYRHTAVKDLNALLENADSLCCKQLVEMEDDCFLWTEIIEGQALGLETNKPTVCKFKVEIDLNVFLAWIDSSLTEKRINYFLEGLEKENIDFNFILHPPYISRMSFKDNLKIVYPLQTSRLKVIDKITFRANRSYTINNKIYTISFIDKETKQYLFTFDSIKNGNLFTNLKQVLDTSTVNSYFDEEVVTFGDGVLINFEVPNPIQMALSKHNNYKIRIVARDLTTKNRG